MIYVPAVSKLDEHTKLTGPSALRDLLNAVLKGVLADSPSYKALVEAFAAFGEKVKGEESKPGVSLGKLEDDISKELEDWGLQFALQVNSLNPDDVVKSLVSHHIIDGVLGAALAPSAFGQGFQRHLIFALIRLAAGYGPTYEAGKKKEFSPRLTWILFEEPEAFLHPTQISILDENLRLFSAQDGQQISLSTHNPLFASRSVMALPSICRVAREGAKTLTGQIRSAELDRFLEANHDCLEDLKKAGIDVTAEDETLAMESIKYTLWMNPHRAAAFFAQRVLLVEGPSEYALITYLLAKRKLQTPKVGISIIDTLGKWNTHRFMNILGALRVPHSVLYDRDGLTPHAAALDKAIQTTRNQFTRGIDYFDKDLEAALGIPSASRRDRKPQHVMWHLVNNKISKELLELFVKKTQALLDA